jgi:hypothetical protein
VILYIASQRLFYVFFYKKENDLVQNFYIKKLFIMKKITLSILAIILSVSVTTYAQDGKKKAEDKSPWNVGGDISLTFLASEFSDSWSGKDGGEDNLTVGALANLFAKYKKDNLSWENNLLAQYTTQRTSVNPDFIKTLDKLELVSFAGYKASENWSYSGVLSIKTQWSPTYLNSVSSGQRDSLITNFFAPGEILIGPGMKYTKGDKKSRSQLTLNVSPATAKFIVIGSQQVADASYGGENSVFEFGASVLGTYRTNITKNLTYASNIELFSNYLKDPQFVDVKWSNIISANILKIITVNFSYDLRYDNDISEEVRTAATFGVGLGYKF